MRRRRLALALAALAVLAWVAACAVVLLGARSAASTGVAAARSARSGLSAESIRTGSAVRPLETARRSFLTAERRFRNPVLLPVRVLPVLGRQLGAATALAAASAEVAGVAADVGLRAKEVLDRPHAGGAEKVELLRTLAGIAADAERRLTAVDLGPSRALVAPVRDRREELAGEVDEARRAAADARVVAEGLATLLSGPRRYLVLAANNAEMRAGSGMFLSAGELRAEGGTLTLGDLRPTGDLHLGERAVPIEDPDLAARWGFLEPNQEWRNLATSPRFPASARLAARMWEALGNPPVDGVLALDPVALRAILAATGPVDAGGRGVGAEDVVRLLLHDQYLAYPVTAPAQAARREQLGQIARGAVGALSTRGFDVAVLARELGRAAGGRHLLGWSRLEGEQRLWQAAGVDGGLESHSLLVSLLNRGGNKLDQFLRTSAALDIRGADATLRLTIENRAPEGEPWYVAGPYPGSGLAAGDHLAMVAVNVPAFAGDVRVDGHDSFVAAGPDGPTQVVAVEVRIPNGARHEVTVRFRLPPRGELVVEPSARLPATEWSGPGGRRWADSERRVVRWG